MSATKSTRLPRAETGRCLLEDARAARPAIDLALLGLLLGLGGAASYSAGSPALAGGLLVGAAAAAVTAWRRWVTGIAWHEFGVSVQRAGASRTLFYHDARGLCYRSRLPRRGPGRRVVLELVARPDLPNAPERVRSRLSVAEGDSTPELLRDRIAEVLADGMQRELDENGRVAWAGGLFVYPRHLEYAGEPRSGRAPVVLPFERIAQLELASGHCLIAGDAEGDPGFRVSETLSNFFPGYALVRRLTAGRETGD